MKIAIVFAGFFRTFEVVKDTFANHILNQSNCDVFFSAPNTMFARPENEVPELHDKYSKNIDAINVSWFGDKLKSFELVDHNSILYKNIISANNISERTFCNQYSWRVLSYMQAISSSISLFKKYVEENNITYDWVVLTRPDVKYYSAINFSLLHNDKINYALHSVVDGGIGTSTPYNDQMLIGSQKNILLHSNLYDNVIRYHKDNAVPFNSEIFGRTHFNRNGIECVGIDFVSYELWRNLI